MSRIFHLVLCSCVLYCGCGESVSEKAHVQKEDIDMEPYWRGQRLYRNHCQTCHQENGEGAGKIYPPLADADYFLTDQARAIRIIKHGLHEEIVVNGQPYENAMPNNVKLVDDDIAAIMTYIGNTWGNHIGNVSREEVRNALNEIK